MKTEITVTDIELALTMGGPLDKRRYVVVPNVYWGWGLSYEADLIAVHRETNCVMEVEIKRTVQDFRNDRKKQKFWERGRLDRRIRRFYYAMPKQIADVVRQELPPGAGLYVLELDEERGVVTVDVAVRAKRVADSRMATPEEIKTLHELASMRYWDLRNTMHRYHRDCFQKPEVPA